MMAHLLNKRCGPFNSVMLGFLATRTGEAAKLACYKPSENQTEIAARKDIAWARCNVDAFNFYENRDGFGSG